MPTGFCICNFLRSLRKAITLFLPVRGHARLSGRHLGDVYTGYARNDSFCDQRFYHPFHPLLTTLLSLGQILFVDRFLEIGDLAIVDSSYDDFIFIRSRKGDVIVFHFPPFPSAVLLTIDDVVHCSHISISDSSQEEGPVATALGVSLPFEVGGICNIQVRLTHLISVSIGCPQNGSHLKVERNFEVIVLSSWR